MSLLLFHPLIVVAWVAAGLILPSPPEFLWLAAYGSLLVAALGIAIYGISDAGRGDLFKLILLPLCMIVVPMAPLMMSYLISGVCFRAARKRGEGDPVGGPLLQLALAWLRSGTMAVIMMVVLLYQYWVVLEHQVLDLKTLYLDPMTLHVGGMGTFVHLALLLAALSYGLLFARTLNLLGEHRKQPLPGSQAETPAQDVVY